MISGETQGFDEVFEFLDDLRAELNGTKGTLYKDISRIQHDTMNVNFSAEGRPRWRERVTGGEWPILDKTGVMKDDALMSTRTWQHSRGVHILNIETPFYGDIHQNTGMPTRGTRVIRDFATPQETDNRAIEKRILKAGTK